MIAVGVFSKGTKSSIIRFYLLTMIISFLNYIGDKNDFFNSYQNKAINSIEKINNISLNTFLHSKIYDTFLSIPIQIYFSKIIQKIFKKRVLYIKNIYYKNYYLVDLSNNKIILSSDNFNNKDKFNIFEYKIFRNRKIKKELLFYCHELKNNYIKKNNMIFNEFEYQKYFIKLEYKATYPRRTFIIKFLPILNGVCIIHEYIQLKLSTFEKGVEKKEVYKEKIIIYGFNSSDKNDINNLFKNEHYILKQLHFFLIESLFCSNSSIQYFFILEKKQKIYFSEEILQIINQLVSEYMEKTNNISSYSKSNNNHNYLTKKIIQKITNRLYEEYIQINSAEKILHESSSAFPLKTLKSDISFKDINFGKNSSLLQITKDEALTYLFKSIKFNKNIDPNDITIDLNDDKNKGNVGKDDSLSVTELIDRNSKPSIRFSDLLSEKFTICPSQDIMKKGRITQNYPFPRDSELNYNNTKESLNNNKKNDYEEMSIGTKIRKKYNYNFNDNNYNDYNVIYNNSLKKYKNNYLHNNSSNKKSIQGFLIDDKTSFENLNHNDKSDKFLNKQIFE